jgi:hypothetical protein
MFKLCTNKNHSYKHNEQINNQNIDNSECFGVKFVKIYPEMTSQYRKIQGFVSNIQILGKSKSIFICCV